MEINPQNIKRLVTSCVVIPFDFRCQDSWYIVRLALTFIIPTRLQCTSIARSYYRRSRVRNTM